jgi:hypothetical protein
METIMRTFGKLEYLEGLVKLAKRKKIEETGKNQVVTVNNTHDVRRISVNKTYRGKTMHLLVEINNGVIEGFVDIGTYMLIIAASIV